MEFPQSYGLQLHLQQPQLQHSALPCDFFVEDGQRMAPFEFLGTIDAGGQDNAQNLRLAPSSDVLQLVPGSIPGSIPAATDGVVGGTDLLFNIGVEPKSKRLKEHDVYENKSQVTFVDYLQLGSVSSGLHLSLGFDRTESSGDSTLFPPFSDGIEEDLLQQDMEMDRFINYEVEQFRKNIMEKVHSSQLQAISLAGGRYLRKLSRKDAEIEILNRRNKELEDQVQQLTDDMSAWQQRALDSESMIAALQSHLQRAYARDDREGCGNSSEVHDTASCNRSTKLPSLTCKGCRVSRACMVLHPCGHICLCKDCDRKLGFCPLCQSKSKGVEVYLS